MSLAKPFFKASSNYNSGKEYALSGLGIMTRAMKQMGAEHANFHEHFADAQKRLEATKNKYGLNELDVEVVRSTALDPYLSEGNLPKVIAFGYLELEKVLKELRLEEQKLGDLQRETARLLEVLSGGHNRG